MNAERLRQLEELYYSARELEQRTGGNPISQNWCFALGRRRVAPDRAAIAASRGVLRNSDGQRITKEPGEIVSFSCSWAVASSCFAKSEVNKLPGQAALALPQSCLVASRAPSTMASNLAHMTSGCTRGVHPPNVPKPQSGAAITFSRPTRRA
jgi:hypothetical protein